MKNHIKISILFLGAISQGTIFGAANFPKHMQNVYDHAKIQGQERKLASELEITSKHEANLRLGRAIEQFNVQEIKLALEEGADLNAKFKRDQFNKKKLLYSLDKESSGYSVLTWAIRNLPSDKVLKEFNFTSTLTKLYENKYLNTLNFLIEKGRINEINNPILIGFRQNTPLMYSIERGYLEVAKFLILNGANINFVSETGDSALTCLFDNAFNIKYDLSFYNQLIELCNGLNHMIIVKNKLKMTPMHYLIYRYSLFGVTDYCKEITKNLIEILIRNGADIHFKYPEGNLIFKNSRVSEIEEYIIQKNNQHNLETSKIFLELSTEQNLLPKDLNLLTLSYLGIVNTAIKSSANTFKESVSPLIEEVTTSELIEPASFKLDRSSCCGNFSSKCKKLYSFIKDNPYRIPVFAVLALFVKTSIADYETI